MGRNERKEGREAVGNDLEREGVSKVLFLSLQQGI
jgi:hypothetical protein